MNNLLTMIENELGREPFTMDDARHLRFPMVIVNTPILEYNEKSTFNKISLTELEIPYNFVKGIMIRDDQDVTITHNKETNIIKVEIK